MKRQFTFNASTLPTEAPLLNTGIYAGKITNASIVSKAGNQFIRFQKLQEWDNDSRTFIDTDEYGIVGSILYGVILTSKKAIETLGRDEPQIYGGAIHLKFENNRLSDVNPTLGAWLEALDLKNTNFNELVSFEFDEEIEIPEGMESIPDIVETLNYVNWLRQYFTEICSQANGLPCKASIEKVSKPTGSFANQIAIGKMRDFCGILKYEEGCENDN